MKEEGKLTVEQFESAKRDLMRLATPNERFAELHAQKDRGELSDTQFDVAHKELVYQVSDETRKTKINPPYRSIQDNSVAFIGWVIAIGLIVVFLYSCAHVFSGPPKSNCSGSVAKDTAYFASQDFVKRNLKSPSSAKFPNSNVPGVSVTELGECRFRITGYVDANNSFGASIRTPYSMTVKSEEGSISYNLEDIAIYE
jgi:hypothetical protein